MRVVGKMGAVGQVAAVGQVTAVAAEPTSAHVQRE